MTDKKLIDLTVNELGKLLCWTLGIAFAIIAIISACYYFFS